MLATQDSELALEEAMMAGKETRFTAHVAIPTQKDVEDALLRKDLLNIELTTVFRYCQDLGD